MKRLFRIVLLAVVAGCQQQPGDTKSSEVTPAGQPRKESKHRELPPGPPIITFENALFSSASPKRLVLTNVRQSPGKRARDKLDWRQRLVLWEVGSGKQVWVQQREHSVNPQAFLEGNAKLLVGNGGSLEVWDTATGKFLQRLTSTDAEGEIVGSLPSLDGRKVLVTRKKTTDGERYSLEVWDVLAGKRLSQAEVGSQNINVSTWSTDGKLVIGLVYPPESNFNAIALWDVTKGKELRQVARPKEGWDTATSGWQIAFSQDCRLTVTLNSQVLKSPDGGFAGRENTLVVWQVDGEKEVARLPLGKYLEPEAVAYSYVEPETVAFSSDNRQLLVGTKNQTIQVWNLERKTLVWTISTLGGEKLDTKTVMKYFFSPDCTLVLAVGTKVRDYNGLYLTVCNVVTGKVECSLRGAD